MVLIDEDTFAPETTDIENIPTRTYENSPVGFALQAKFGNPIAVKLLVPQGAGRLSTYARRSLPKDSSSALLDSYLTLSFANEIAAQNAVQRLRGLVGVRWAGVLLAQKFSQATTTDPLFTGAVGSSPFAQQWGLNAVNANSAWSLIDGIAYVGVNDNGIQASHEDFADFSYGSAFKPQFSTNVVAGYTANVDERALNENYAGHGTHVSRIIAARHNGIGGAGICKGCSLMTTKKAVRS